jgi:ribonuclease BN (tRNA processing enzyme)
MNIYFHGVRGSYPCSGKGYLIGGHTSCVEVSIDNTSYVFDCGTGVLNFSQRLKTAIPNNVYLFLSHFHIDHVIGITLLSELMQQKLNLTLYSPILNQISAEYVFDNLIREPYYPFNAQLFKSCVQFRPFTPGDTIRLQDIKIQTLPLLHPGGSCGYRLCHLNKSVSYITDIGLNQNCTFQDDLLDFIESTDLLIQDTTFTEADLQTHATWGHASIEKTALLSKEASVRWLALYHHNPLYNDEKLLMNEKRAQAIFPNAFLSYENQALEL